MAKGKKPPRKYPSGAEKRRRAKERGQVGASAEPAAVALDFSDCFVKGAGPKAMVLEALKIKRKAARLALTADPATGAALERASRILDGLIKGADQRKQIDELAADLRQAAADIEDLEQSRGAPKPASGSREPATPSVQ
jgi:hypothetical protein